MDFEFSQRADVRQTPRIVPEQIFAGKILQMPMMELETFLRVEFQENPALLMEEAEPEAEAEASLDDDWEPSTFVDLDDDYDPYRTVADLPSLSDHLKSQFRTQFAEEFWPIGLDIIDSLGEDGYFREEILDAADRFTLSVPEFEEHLARVQSLDPPGIAARDVRECLRLQTARDECAPALCLRILETDTWMLIARHDVAQIARLTGANEDEALEAMEWIRDNTCPYPAEDYRPEFESLAPRKKPLEKPDVVVRVNGTEIWVDCPGLTNVRLGLDPFYENLYQRIRRVRGVTLGAQEKHVTDFVDRAKLISYAIDLRGQTLHRIADHVVHYQRELVLHGLRYVKPYTQKQVAEVLGVHESTVCRATAGKLVQLPNGETVTFDVFFDDAAPVRDMVADIIGHEDKRNPLKDGQVAEELERRGVKIARRTVAKYRDLLKILPCEMRKER